MAKLILFEKEVTLEEYVVAEGTLNYGTSTRITSSVLKDILDVCEITYKKNITKKEMIYQLYEYFKDWGVVAQKIGVGVHINQYLAAFPFVTKEDIKRLEKFEVLKVVSYQEFRLYGQYRYTPLYDLEQFLNMNEEMMNFYLNEYPKGKRKSMKEGEKK